MSALSAVHSNGAVAVGADDEDEEVDAFGRIVPKESRRRSRSRSRSRSNSPDRDDSDFRRRRYADSDDSRRRRSRSPDRQRDRDAGRDRDRGDRRGGGARREERRRDDRRPPPSAPILNIAPRNFHRPPPTHQQPFPPPPAAFPPYPPHQYPHAVHPSTFPSLPAASSHTAPLLSLHEWMAAHGVDGVTADVERRYGEYRADGLNAPKRGYFDAHKQEEWLTHQYGYPASPTQLAQRLQQKQQHRQHWLADVHSGDSAHLHLLDDVSSAPSHSVSTAFVDNTIVIPPFPHRVNRSSLLSFVSSLPGFRLLSVAASTAKNHGNRIAFLVLSSPAACSAAVEQCKGQRVDSWEVRMRGSVREVARRDVTALVREERKVQEDVQRAGALISRLDEESGLPSFSLPAAEGESGDADMRRLNTCLSYLRWVHSYCFYCGREYRDVEALINACGMTHRRRTDISGGVVSDSDKEEVERIERRVDERTRGDGGWVEDERRKLERVKEALLRRYIEQKAESKWRCVLCNKLFRGEEFVVKHILNKHEAEMREVEARLPDEYMWREYAADQHAPVEERDRQQSSGGGGGGMQQLSFRPGQPLSALTTMPYVPGLHDSAMMDAQQQLPLLSPSPAAVVSLPTISIAPLSLVPPQPMAAAPPAVSGRRGLTSYADLDVPDVAPQLPSHGLLLTPADKAAVHYGSKGKWVPKSKKGKDSAADENGKSAEAVDGVEEKKEAAGTKAEMAES